MDARIVNFPFMNIPSLLNNQRQYFNSGQSRDVNFRIQQLKKLKSVFEKYEDDPEYHVFLVSLNQMLKESKRKSSLPFLEGNEKLVLIGDLLHFYMRPIYLFKDSEHFFDKEGSIEDKLKDIKIKLEDKILENYSFLDSKDNRLIQISDVVVGFTGKLFDFLNDSTIVAINDGRNEISHCIWR